MTQKLILQLENSVIDRARRISEKKGISISELISDYITSLNVEILPEESELTPIVRSMKGVLKESDLDETDYKNYLVKKYL